ncbi:MAG: hypothetical protein R2707_03385 [Acidimicrobiales bacterium]
MNATDLGCADGFPHDLLALSLRMAGTPCGPLRKSTGFPDLEVAAVVDEVLGRSN